MKSLKSATSVVKSNIEKSAHIVQPQSNKMDNHKIIYNKKAESEFFVDNSALAGFSGERILYMAVRELIENALDSCETFSILPSIKITLKTFDQTNDLWLLSCEDNGTGINSDKLPVAVCSFLTSAKYMEKQQRGLFGVGLKMVAAFSTKDTDFPIRVWSKSIEETEEYYFELRTDIGTNKPIVLKKIINKSEPCIKSNSGFKIKVILRARLVPITKNKIYDYVTQSSIVNPYALITFETDDGTFTFDRRTSIMPNPAKEILPHPSDMDLQTLKKAISKFTGQKVTLAKILCSSFQKLSYEKAKEILSASQLNLDIKSSISDLSEHDLIKIVNICKKTKFQNPNTDHLSPIGQEILTIGMMSEYTIVSNKNSDYLSHDNRNINNDITIENKLKESDISDGYKGESKTEIKNNSSISKSNFSVKVLQPVLTAYTSRIGIINNRPTIVETGLAYGGDINSFKLYRFANKIPLLYDEGSDVAREVVSEVEINKMGITKKQAKEQFSSNKDSKRDRIIEVLPIHIFFHICSTKIPYKTAGKESIASEGELKSYMKSCLSELYRKLSSQIRKELKIKEAENKLKLYKHYLPFIVDAINDSLGIKNSKLNESFSLLIESHLAKKSNINDIIDEGNNVASQDIISEPSSPTISPPFQSPKIENKIKRPVSASNSKSVSITNQKEGKHNDPKSFLNRNNIKTNKKNKVIIDNNKHLEKNSKDKVNEKNSKIIGIKNKTINTRPTLDTFHSQRRVNKGK
ncbi:MAG: DNA topoisomerase VI subunit B [Candidatus Nitrosocosmicus sp.]